uniref:Mediator of RNA polymerase II transcription subunit 21 n=1 Tax=Heterorhabditis bacteriophora TaxID=37862 RepID=A0A1I7WFI8_HETBA
MSLMLIKPAIKSACHTLQATISNYKSLTEQHSFPEQDRELREYCIRRITQLQLAIVKIATASSLVSKSVEEMQAIITNSKTRAQRKEHLSEILVITEEIPYQKTLAEATELTFTLDTVMYISIFFIPLPNKPYYPGCILYNSYIIIIRYTLNVSSQPDHLVTDTAS